MKFIHIIILFIAVVSTSCSRYAYQYQTGSTALTKTVPSKIKLYSGDIDQSYTIIGSVTADVLGSGDEVANYLKKKAASLGADAIIHVELSKLNSLSLRTGVSGVAVRLE